MTTGCILNNVGISFWMLFFVLSKGYFPFELGESGESDEESIPSSFNSPCVSVFANNFY